MSTPKFSQAPLRYSRFQIGCIFAEYYLFKHTIFIQNLIYTDFCINLTQFLSIS